MKQGKDYEIDREYMRQYTPTGQLTSKIQEEIGLLGLELDIVEKQPEMPYAMGNYLDAMNRMEEIKTYMAQLEAQMPGLNPKPSKDKEVRGGIFNPLLAAIQKRIMG